MRVLMLVHSDYIHDNRVKRQAETLIKNGYHITCACIGESIPEYSDGVKLLSYQPKKLKGKRRFLEVIRFFGRIIKSSSYDIIHAHDLDAYFAATLYGNVKRDAIIYDSHEIYTQSTGVANRFLPKLIWSVIERATIHRASRVITVNDSIAELLQKKYRLKERPAVVRNFTSLKRSAGHVPVFINEARRLKSETNFLLIYHGIIQNGRGLDLLFETLKETPGISAIICGDGPKMKFYQDLSSGLELDNRVLFTGFINSSEFLALSAFADMGYCIIEPISESYYFSLPNKLTEYIQAGLPILASGLPEISRIVKAYSIGLTIPPEELFVNAVIERISSFRENPDRFKPGLNKAAKELNWDTEKERLLDVYAELKA